MIYFMHFYFFSGRHEPVCPLQHFLETCEDEKVVDLGDILG